MVLLELDPVLLHGQWEANPLGYHCSMLGEELVGWWNRTEGQERNPSIPASDTGSLIQGQPPALGLLFKWKFSVGPIRRR